MDGQVLEIKKQIGIMFEYYPMGKLLVLMEHISVTIYQMERVVDTVSTWYVSLVDLQMGKNYD